MCTENTSQLYAEIVWLEFHVNIYWPLTFELASPLMKSWMVTLSNYWPKLIVFLQLGRRFSKTGLSNEFKIVLPGIGPDFFIKHISNRYGATQGPSEIPQITAYWLIHGGKANSGTTYGKAWGWRKRCKVSRYAVACVSKDPTGREIQLVSLWKKLGFLKTLNMAKH